MVLASSADLRTVGCLRRCRVAARVGDRDDHPADRAECASHAKEASVRQASLVHANVDDTYHRRREPSTDTDASSGNVVRRHGRGRVRGGIALYSCCAYNDPMSPKGRVRSNCTRVSSTRGRREGEMVGHANDVVETVIVPDLAGGTKAERGLRQAAKMRVVRAAVAQVHWRGDETIVGMLVDNSLLAASLVVQDDAGALWHGDALTR